MADMIKPSRRLFVLAIALAAVVSLTAACGGGSSSDESNGGDGPAATEPADNGDAGDADDSGDSGDGFTGEPRGVVEVDGAAQGLALSPETGMSTCVITDSMVAATMMVTEEGNELYVSGGDVWSASFETPGNLWEAASHESDSEVTREISKNHAVIEGTWVSETTGDTAEIRVELFCPSE